MVQSLVPSTRYMELQGTSSAGPLQSGSRQLWNQSPWTNYEYDAPDQGRFVVYGTADTAGGEYEYLLRALSCAMIQFMPRECLEEAVGSLKDILAFWMESRMTTLALPRPVHRASARIGPVGERPPFVVPE